MNIYPYIIQNPFYNTDFLLKKMIYLSGNPEKNNIINYNYFQPPLPFLFNTPIIFPDNKNENIKNQIEIKNNILNEKPKKNIFKVEYPDEVSLFTENESNLNTEETEPHLIKSKEKLSRKYNKDNIVRKIKREFFNKIIIQKLNAKLKNAGSKLYFTRFPQSFVSNILKKNNKEILYLTLGEIIEKKEIINPKNDIDLENYEHNLKVIKSPDVSENKEFQKILNMTYSYLFEEYLNSDEFNKKVIIW